MAAFFFPAPGSTVFPPSGGGSGAVDSVNGQTGVVVLDADDVGAADQALSNLSAVQMNEGLFFAVGVSGLLRTDANPAGSTTDLQIGTGDAGAGNSGGLILTTGSATGGNSQNIYLQTGTAEAGFNGGGIDINAAAATGAGNAGNVAINAGNAEDGPAGSITLTPGTESGSGTPGAIRFLNSNEGTAGHVWTSTDTNGTGAWAAASGGMDWSVPIDSNITADTADTYDIGSNVAALASIYTNFVRSNNSLGIDAGGNIEITGGNDAIYLYATSVAPSVFFYDDTTSFAVAVKAPSALVADTLFQFPPDNGTAGYVLSTNGSGVTSWIAAGSGSDPLLLSNGTAADPAYSFTSEDNTGMYLSAANILRFSVAGNPILTIGVGGIGPGANNSYSLGAAGSAWTGVTSYQLATERLILSYSAWSASAFELYGFVPPNGSGIVWGLQGLTGATTDGIGVLGGANVSSGSTARSVHLEAQNNTGAGNGGAVNIWAGTSGSGNRGNVVVAANSLVLPTAAGDPAGNVVAGSIYYNTGTNKIKMYNGSTWETVTSV